MNGPYSKFFWKLFLANAFLLIVVVGSCVWLILTAFHRFYSDELTLHLRGYAELLRQNVGGEFGVERGEALDRLAKNLAAGDPSGIRVTLVAADGRVLADSFVDPTTMSSHSDRPEIQQALRQGVGTSTRWSHTLSREMTYVALRVGSADAPKGIVRTALPTRSLAARMESARDLPWIIGSLVVLAGLLLAMNLTRLWIRPIARLTASARRLSHGDLTSRAESSGVDELSSLASSLNQMRENMAGQLEANYRQRRTLEYLLAQLHEGVVVADHAGRIMLLNPAAASMLGVSVSVTGDARLVEGLTVEMCIPQHDVQRMLTLDDSIPTVEQGVEGVAGEDGLHDHAERFREQRVTVRRPGGNLLLLGRVSEIALPAPPNDAERKAGRAPTAKPGRGRLLVLTDITELNRTLQVKSDFAANASHELRTPLAAIRAAVETVTTLNAATEAEQASRLLGVIDRHSARLEALVADLLDLSRLESPSAEFTPSTVHFREILEELQDLFATALDAKSLHWEAVFSPEDDQVLLNRQLIRLVLDNLVDNAIKFSEPGGSVRALAECAGGWLSISVEDDGCGIPQHEHERVFERFYQVERARSGRDRGTGLGLSIVRHAVSAMNGTIELESAPGQGTRITVGIPQPEDKLVE